MCHFDQFNIQADLIELEQVGPRWFCRIIRRYVPAYWSHLFIFWRFSSAFCFASTGF